MQPLPRLFSDKGVFVEPDDVTGLDAPTLALLETVRTAYHATRVADAAMVDAIAELAASEAAVKNTQTYFAAHYPPQTFHSLFLETFGGKEAERRGYVRK
jgi:hypothetical protein